MIDEALQHCIRQQSVDVSGNGTDKPGVKLKFSWLYTTFICKQIKEGYHHLPLEWHPSNPSLAEPTWDHMTQEFLVAEK